MNILVPDSWLREYLDTKATPQELKEYLSLCGPTIERINKVGDDLVYDIEVTTNRVDMASVYGIAREAAAILPRFGIKTKLKNISEVNTPRGWHRPKDTSDGGRQAIARHDSSEVEDSVKLPMNISDPEFICNRVMSIVLEVDPMKSSPDYVKDRLEKSGVRALNNLVDITNYVMLEIGHPSHVFDYARIKTHQFIIRFAKKNEPIITLDNKKYALDETDVIIDDGTGRVIDLPGIMGTENSVVTKNTRRIIFFIESNNPALIRKTSMRYGIRTMAATINEKHPDPELVKTALFRGIELYQKWAGGKIAGEVTDIYPHPTKPKSITVSIDFINERLGIKLKKQEMVNILKSLHFSVIPSEAGYSPVPGAVEGFRSPKTVEKDPSTRPDEESGLGRDDYLKVTPPTYRQFDVTIPEDIVEEVARIYGYHNLPIRLITGEILQPKYTSGVTRRGSPDGEGIKIDPLSLEYKLKTILKYWGYTETYHYSFISGKLIEKVGLKKGNHLKVANPLTEETEYMRTNLIPSMLETIAKNQHQKDNLQLFELSKVYLPHKQRAIKPPRGWQAERSEAMTPPMVEEPGLPNEISMLTITNQKSFYHLKGIVEGLLRELGITNYELEERASLSPFFHPLQVLQMAKDQRLIATVGKLHPSQSSAFDIKKDTHIAYLNMENLITFYNPLKKYIPIPEYPPIIEDMTINIQPKTQIGPIISDVYSRSNLIKHIDVKDTYKNSVTLRLTYQSDKHTLTEEDIRPVREVLANIKV